MKKPEKYEILKLKLISQTSGTLIFPLHVKYTSLYKLYILLVRKNSLLYIDLH